MINVGDMLICCGGTKDYLTIVKRALSPGEFPESFVYSRYNNYELEIVESYVFTGKKTHKDLGEEIALEWGKSRALVLLNTRARIDSAGVSELIMKLYGAND